MTYPGAEWKNAPEAPSYAVICHESMRLEFRQWHLSFVIWVHTNFRHHHVDPKAGTTSQEDNFGKPGYITPNAPEGHGKHQYYSGYWRLDSELICQQAAH